MIETMFRVNHVEVEFEGFNEPTMQMAEAAVKYAEDNKENDKFVISKIVVKKDGKEADFHVEYNDDDQPKIAHIRRITG